MSYAGEESACTVRRCPQMVKSGLSETSYLNTFHIAHPFRGQDLRAPPLAASLGLVQYGRSQVLLVCDSKNHHSSNFATFSCAPFLVPQAEFGLVQGITLTPQVRCMGGEDWYGYCEG